MTVDESDRRVPPWIMRGGGGHAFGQRERARAAAHPGLVWMSLSARARAQRVEHEMMNVHICGRGAWAFEVHGRHVGAWRVRGKTVYRIQRSVIRK